MAQWVKDLVFTSVAGVTAVVWVQFLAWELPLAMGVAEKKKKVAKAEINMWNYIKPKISFTAKGITIKMKRQPTEWEKIFANLIFDKGLITQNK